MSKRDPEYHRIYIKKHYQENKAYYIEKNKSRRANLSPEQKLFENLRTKSRALGIPFNITVDDIKIPDVCPVFGILLQKNPRYRDNWPSVDRMIPELGYIPGNISVISYKANRIKNNATVSEIEMLFNWMKKKR